VCVRERGEGKPLALLLRYYTGFKVDACSQLCESLQGAEAFYSSNVVVLQVEVGQGGAR